MSETQPSETLKQALDNLERLTKTWTRVAENLMYPPVVHTRFGSYEVEGQEDA